MQVEAPASFLHHAAGVGLPGWYACRTRSRAEKKVDRLLGGSGVPSYLPLIEQRRQWSDRKKTVQFPLFPGYVFARFALSHLDEIVRIPGVVEIVRMGGRPVPVHEHELESIRVMVNGPNELEVEPSDGPHLVAGQLVEVVTGPFRGVRGILVEARGEPRVVVRVHAMRQAVSVEVGRSSVRPLSDSELY